MPTYHDVLAAGALRVDALVGAQKTDLQNTYATRPLTAANFQSTIFPFDDLKANLGWAEQQIALAVAQTGNSSLQAYILSTTAGLTNAAPLPSVDINGVPIIGNWGVVRDGTTKTICFPKPIAQIQRRTQNAGGFYINPVWQYAMEGPLILHTRSSVKIDCSVYDGDARLAAIDADGDLLFPNLESLYIDGMLSRCVRDDEFASQAGIYMGYFQAGLMAIRQGMASVVGNTAQSPVAA